MKSRTSIHWKKPKQARSQETLDRILAATEQLLETKHFEDLTIIEIAERAGCSVGGFYARFRDKQALFDCLFNRYLDEQQATAQEYFEPGRWNGVNLRGRIDAFVRFAIEFNRENFGVFRALRLFGLRQIVSQPGPYFSSQVPILDQYRALFLDCEHEMNHPNPILAVHLGFFTILAAINEKTIFPHTAHARATDVSDDELAHEMTRFFLRYVGAPDPDTDNSVPEQ